MLYMYDSKVEGVRHYVPHVNVLSSVEDPFRMGATTTGISIVVEVEVSLTFFISLMKRSDMRKIAAEQPYNELGGLIRLTDFITNEGTGLEDTVPENEFFLKYLNGLLLSDKFTLLFAIDRMPCYFKLKLVRLSVVEESICIKDDDILNYNLIDWEGINICDSEIYRSYAKTRNAHAARLN
jgi:hypothetical protein